MINRLRKKIIVFAAVVVCSVPLAAKRVNAAKAEILPTATTPSSTSGITMQSFPKPINDIILAHAGWTGDNGDMQIAIMFNRVALKRGCFKVETKSGLSLTVSSKDWFQFRRIIGTVCGTNDVFPIPVLEYDSRNAPLSLRLKGLIVKYVGPSVNLRGMALDLAR